MPSTNELLTTLITIVAWELLFMTTKAMNIKLNTVV